MCICLLPGEKIIMAGIEVEAQYKSGLRSCLVIRAPRSVRFTVVDAQGIEKKREQK
jgi:hypothetical protein